MQARLLKYADAAVTLERALSLDPGLREARYALGTSLMRLGKTDEAKRALETFQQQQAEAEAAGQRAFRLDAIRREASKDLLAGALERAIASYEEALKVDSASARSHRDLGLALLRAQRTPETSEGFAYLADAYLAAGNRDESARQRALSRYHTGQAKLDRIQQLAR